jgi:hypothetical protein
MLCDGHQRVEMRSYRRDQLSQDTSLCNAEHRARSEQRPQWLGKRPIAGDGGALRNQHQVYFSKQVVDDRSRWASATPEPTNRREVSFELDAPIEFANMQDLRRGEGPVVLDGRRTHASWMEIAAESEVRAEVVVLMTVDDSVKRAGLMHDWQDGEIWKNLHAARLKKATSSETDFPLNCAKKVFPSGLRSRVVRCFSLYTPV